MFKNVESLRCYKLKVTYSFFVALYSLSNVLLSQTYSDTIKSKNTTKISRLSNDSMMIFVYGINKKISKEKYYYKSKLIQTKTWYYEDSSYGYISSIKGGNSIKSDTIKSFYLNGNAQLELVFVDNKQHGQHILYYPNGQIKCLYYYKMNNRDSINTTYYANGQIEAFCKYKNGRLDSVMKFYYDNGSLWSERLYKYGRLVKIVSNIDINGIPLKLGTFENGNGTINIYDKNGKLVEIEYYKSGKLKKTKFIK